MANSLEMKNIQEKTLRHWAHMVRRRLNMLYLANFQGNKKTKKYKEEEFDRIFKGIRRGRQPYLIPGKPLAPNIISSAMINSKAQLGLTSCS